MDVGWTLMYFPAPDGLHPAVLTAGVHDGVHRMVNTVGAEAISPPSRDIAR